MRYRGRTQMRAAAIIGASMFLLGCATGGAIDYLHNEYGAAQPDGTVDMPNANPDLPPEVYKVWLHKTKQRMIVQPPLSAAFGTGFAKGATFGAVDASPVQPIFEQAALKYLAEQKSPDCRISHPSRIHELIWEFDYDCSPPPAPNPSLGAKRKRPT